ncbi:MAG: hypothetical protein ACKOD3_13695 [Phenylobacterium sp.]
MSTKPLAPGSSGPLRGYLASRVLSLASTFLLVLTLTPLPALAFDPFPVAGGAGEHRRILDAALACGADGAADCWSRAALDRFEPALRRPDITAITVWNPAHCDSGDPPADGRRGGGRRGPEALSACRDWIRTELDAALRSADRLVDAAGAPRPMRGTCGTFNLGDPDPLCALDHHLGRALHAAQDFYSHTNWTDVPIPADRVSLHTPQGLGGSGPIPWMAPGDRAPPPAGLMSGCFTFFPEPLFCQGRTRHADMNKDRRAGPETPPVGATPRGAVDGNFLRAFDAATGETARIWGEVQSRLISVYGETRGRAMACIIRRGPTAGCGA